MLFGRSEPDSGRQACKKIKKKFRTRSLQRSTFQPEWGWWAKSCPWEEVDVPVLGVFLGYNVFHDQNLNFPQFSYAS